MDKQVTCVELIFDAENADSNTATWNTYGSELAGGFGVKYCGKPVVWDGRCEEHKIERRSGKDRRQTK